MTPILLVEIEPNTGRFRTQFSNDKSVASFILEEGVMYIWGGRGDWVEFKEDYKIVEKIDKQQL